MFLDSRGVFGDPHGVVQHHAFLLSDGSCCVIFLQRFDQILIQRDPTQKLCVRFDSIDAPVRDRNHGGDHFVLAAAEWKLR
jgi:hypothetical protein